MMQNYLKGLLQNVAFAVADVRGVVISEHSCAHNVLADVLWKKEKIESWMP